VGLAVEFWKNREDIAHQWQVDQKFDPQLSTETGEQLKTGWKKALERSNNWVAP
jgi:glycerol kinase